MPNIEQIKPVENTEMIWKNPEDALNALTLRDSLVTQEADELWKEMVLTTEFFHQHQQEMCGCIDDLLPDLPHLQLLTA